MEDGLGVRRTCGVRSEICAVILKVGGGDVLGTICVHLAHATQAWL
jgi:hypothetical protein